MAIPLTGTAGLFTRLGRIGRFAYVLAGDQAGLPAAYASLNAQFATSQLDIIGPINASADRYIRSIPPQVMGQLQQLAQSTLIEMVTADQPAVPAQVAPCLLELRRQMLASGDTVPACTVGASATAFTSPAVVGNGAIVLSTKRGDGLANENLVAESGAILSCTFDSYSGGRVAGQETFQFTGEADLTRSVWDYDWPQGSAAGTSIVGISPASYSQASGNLLNNGDFENWGTSPVASNQWQLTGGTWGTTVSQSSTAFNGSFSLQFATGATPAIAQPFGDGTLGTSARVAATTNYAVNLWARTGTGTASAGVITVELVDGSGTVTNDAQGVPNSFTFNATALSTTWQAFHGTFRPPAILPATLQLRIRVSTALVGAAVLVADVAMAQLTALYPAGPRLAIFRGDIPWVAGDSFYLAGTNDRAGASYTATWQALFLKLFGQSGFLLPSTSGTPTIADSLITAP